jgi:hypothetical protein
MKVFVKGEPEVNLTKSHFVAEGGEGKVYARGKTGFKIYHDPAKAIPLGKIQELSGIRDPNVIKPEDALYKGKRAQHVGHTFRFVKDTWTLCQLFPRAFREREGFTHELALKLVRRLQAGVQSVHAAGVLIVDLNEMNFLVSKDFETPYFIDVDSYQTSHYPATAIMPSVRDPLVQGLDFTDLSDWFSFGIVSFQLLCGIHPFKGKHPTIKGIEDRMRAGVSVFDKNVKVPKVAYPTSIIPDIYRDWYESMFVHGKRLPPPDGLHGVIVVRPTVRKIAGTDNFEIVEIAEYAEEIRSVFVGGGHVVVHSDDQIFVDKRPTVSWHDPFVIGFTPKHGHPVAALSIKNGTILTDTITQDPLGIQLPQGETMMANETIYIRSGDKILEVTFTEAANKVIPSSRVAANVLEHACRLFEGVAIQNLLGEPHVSLFPRPGACYQSKVPELKGHKVVEAKFDNGVLMVVAAEKGKYHRFVFRFDKDYASYDVRKVEDVTATGLNFVTLDSGVCVCLNEDEQIELFSSRKGSTSVKTIEDPVLGGDMRLVKNQGQLQFFRGNKLYRMKMK